MQSLTHSHISFQYKFTPGLSMTFGAKLILMTDRQLATTNDISMMKCIKLYIIFFTENDN